MFISLPWKLMQRLYVEGDILFSHRQGTIGGQLKQFLGRRMAHAFLRLLFLCKFLRDGESYSHTERAMLQQKIVNQKLFDLGMSIAQLSGISGVRENKLSPWLRGTGPLSNESYLTVEKTLLDVQALVELFAPAPLDLRNAFVVKDLIARMRSGEFEYLTRIKALVDNPQNAAALEIFKTLKAEI